MAKHRIDVETCPYCEEILLTAHPEIAEWFRTMKGYFNSLHLSCAYRGEEDQNKAFKEGKSKLRFPHSKHNAVQDGKPCSLALDVFALDDSGEASFTSRYYYLLNAMTIREGFQNIEWGGSWKKFKDLPHFQLKG